MHISNPLVAIGLRMQKIKIGRNSKFFGVPVIVKTRQSSISIGKNFVLISGFLDNLVGLYQRSIIIARNGGKISIGDDVSMSGVTVYAFDEIIIEDKVTIGANTKILDSDFHPINPEIRRNNPDDKQNTCTKKVVIKENAFVGCNCLILKGVTIGENSVIGAGSVVCKDIPANVIAAGNPARIIKYL